MENFLYNPDQKSKAQVKEEFVVRTNVFEDIMHDLESSEMKKPEQHYLLIGQRGTGKTTLLLRLRYAIEDSEKLNPWLIPVGFNEEQYSVTELADLWKTIAEYLEDNYGFEGLAEKIDEQYDNNDYEEKCYDILEKALKDSNKKIILLIDNIGDLFKKFDDKEVRRLREILQTKEYLRLIAGSPFYLDTVLDYKQPFFEFFKVKRLEGLTAAEAQAMLQKLGDIHGEREKIDRIITETPQRIETLRILTSGVPRTIALLFQIFIDHEHESSMKDLVRVLDAVTPLYKHRMDDLPTQQQKIVDAVARHWDAISVKDLREKLKLESKVISAQLRQLEKNQVIEKRETGTKNHLYLLQDRFWNIWYLMRNGRKKESERVVWLVRFLENWCSPEDFEKRIATYVNQIKENKLDENTKELYAQVYSSLKNLTSDQKFLLKNNINKEIADRITITEEEAVEEGERLIKNQQYEQAIKAIFETEKLLEENKGIISSAINSMDFNEAMDFFIRVLSQEEFLYYEGRPAYITFILEMNLRLIVRDLSSKDFESGYDKIILVHQLIKTFQNVELDYEYTILGRIAASYLLFKKFNHSKKFFEIFDDYDLKNKVRPIYFASLLLNENTDKSELNNYGSELDETTSKIIKQIHKFWNRDSQK